MSVPSTNNTTRSSFSNNPVEKKDEEVKDTEGYQSSDSSVEETPQQSETEALQSKFHSLMNEYQHSISFTSGCGARGQGYIDNAWSKIENFVSEHPEFAKETPRSKYISRDDGTGGFATGMGTFAANARRNDDDCSIQ